MVEITRTATVGGDGMIHLALPEIGPGIRVEIVVRRSEGRFDPHESTGGESAYRTLGGLEGKVRIANDFDAPLPEMEPYS